MTRPIQDLLAVAEAYQAGTGLSDSRVATIVFNDGKRLKQLRAGADMGCCVVEKALVWFAQNWPIPAEWPREVEIPAGALADEGGAGRDPEPDQRRMDPERQKQADRIAEDFGFKLPPSLAEFYDDDAAVHDLPAGDPFNLALGVYAEAIVGHRKLLTKVTAEAVALARQGVIEAHLEGARDRAAGLVDAADAWNLGVRPTLKPCESIPLRKPMTFGDLAAESLLDEEMTVYEAAIAAHYRAPSDLGLSFHVNGARRALLAAFKDALSQQSAAIAGLKAQLSAAEARIRRYQPDPLKVPKGQAPCCAGADDNVATSALVDRLYTCFFTMTIDDASQPGTPERSRFMERLRILDEVMGALKGRAGC